MRVRTVGVLATSMALIATTVPSAYAAAGFPTFATSALINQYTGMCMAVAGASTTEGAKVIQWNCDQRGEQWWQMDSGGFVYNYNSGLCLAVAGASKAEGADVIQWACDGDDEQVWDLVLVDSSTAGYELMNENSKMCLADPGASDTQGVQMIQWPCKGISGAEQLWYVDTL